MIEVMAMKKLRTTRHYPLLYSPRKCFMMTKNEQEKKKKLLRQVPRFALKATNRFTFTAAAIIETKL